jgi:hypothetical protein
MKKVPYDQFWDLVRERDALKIRLTLAITLLSRVVIWRDPADTQKLLDEFTAAGGFKWP